MQLSGKVAIVTGAARGLGRAYCEALAKEGARVVAADLNPCTDTIDAIVAAGGSGVAIQVDVSNAESCDSMAQRAMETFGRVDVLINNAGMSPLYKSLTDVSQDLFDKVMNVNLRGPFRLSALFGQQMFNDGNGSIINVSSIAAAQPSPHEVPYGAAKAGLHSLTKSFSRAYAPHVRVNCIMPGPFLTDISDAWSDATHESLKHLPLGRGGHPDEVVGAALYFASEASSYTTGAVLKIDGGSIASTS